MRMTKRFRILLAYILAGVMIFSAVPVLAEEPEGVSGADGEAQKQESTCTTPIRVEDGVVYVYNEETGEWTKDDALTESLMLDGDLTTDLVINLFQGDGILLAPALEVMSEEEDTSFTVGGSVTMENGDDTWGDQLTAVEIGGEGLDTTLTVEEDIVSTAKVTVPEPENTEPGTDSESGAESDPDAKVNSEGDPETESGEWKDTSASVDMLALEVWASDGAEDGSDEGAEEGGEIQGEETLTKVEVHGSVIAEASAEGEDYAGARADTMRIYTSGEEAEAVVTVEKDAIATATATDRGEDGELDERAEATVIHIDGSGNAEITVKGDAVATAEAPDGNADAKVVEAYVYGGETAVHIEGNATASIEGNDIYDREEEPQGAITVLVDNYEATVTVDVDKKIEAKSDVPGDAPVAVNANAWGEGSLTQVTAGEGVEGRIMSEAVAGGQTVITVEEGGVTAETGALLYNPWRYQTDGDPSEGVKRDTINEAVYVSASDGGQAEISVVGDTVVSNSAEIPVAYGVGLHVTKIKEEEEESSITAAFEGNVTAELNEISDTAVETETVAMTLENENGTMNVVVEGDVKASGAKDNFGIYVETAEGSETDILVDGTVSADSGAIVLSGETTKIGENVTLTVWQLEPDEDGDVVVIGTKDEDTGRIALEEDEAAKAKAEEAEKNIQYIIRVAAGQENVIQTEGAGEYTGANGKKYNVAHENDTVLVKLNIPEGYVITGAYWDEGQEHALLKNERGEYYLEVPRGGGVVLSVAMEQEKKEEPEKEEEKNKEPAKQDDPVDEPEKDQKKENEQAAPAVIPEEETGNSASPAAAPRTAANYSYTAPIMKAVTELLKIKDRGDRMVITFLSDGTYRADYWDGTSELGKFSLKEGCIVLVNDKDPEMTEMFLKYNNDTKLYEMTFRGTLERAAAETFSFELAQDQIDILVLNRLAA